MRLATSMASANEALVALINNGYQVLAEIQSRYEAAKNAGSYQDGTTVDEYRDLVNTWANDVVTELRRIFPTDLEVNLFLNPIIPFGAVSGDYQYQSLLRRFRHYIRGLEDIRKSYLSDYTDLPIQDRLYVEDIDSFRKVRDVNPRAVADVLNNGFLAMPEDDVQVRLEQILDVSFHRKDWGGESNDLCTANVVVNGDRRATAFLLKGPGIGKKEMTISDCGKNGDQLVRLFTTPADLFVVQYVGPISDMLVRDVQGKVAERRAAGGKAHFLILDGQDTARLLRAYRKL